MPDMRHIRERALDAYSAWVRLSQGSAATDDVATLSSAVDAAMLSTHPLTILALDSLNLHDTDPDIFHHAVADAMYELVRSTVGSEKSCWLTDTGCHPSGIITTCTSDCFARFGVGGKPYQMLQLRQVMLMKLRKVYPDFWWRLVRRMLQSSQPVCCALCLASS